MARAAGSSPTIGIDRGPPELAGSIICFTFSVLNALTTLAFGCAAWISSALLPVARP